MRTGEEFNSCRWFSNEGEAAAVVVAGTSECALYTEALSFLQARFGRAEFINSTAVCASIAEAELTTAPGSPIV